MRTFGLTGRSGTGKSYQAMNLCREKNIDYVIDDGLLISSAGILAGTSAKRESTKIGAVKTALFSDDTHSAEVSAKIHKINPDAILVLGTSENMIHRIVQRLNLPAVTEMIHIEEITTEEQRAIAKHQRENLGKHIIPAPTFQVKRQFSGYFMDPLRIFRGKVTGRPFFSERTVVRPTYSYLGDYIISDRVIWDIVSHIGEETEGIAAVQKIITDNNDNGLQVRIHVFMEYGKQIIEIASQFQKSVAVQVESMTAFNILSVDIDIRGLKQEKSQI